MTVQNAVGRWLARWIMRLEAAGQIIRMASLGLTGISTGVLALKQFGYSGLARPFVAVLLLGGLGFAYAYAEFGVWNQKSRDTADAGDNYSGPTMLMDSRIEARQLARLGYRLGNGGFESAEDAEQEMLAITREEWEKLRDGVEVEQ